MILTYYLNKSARRDPNLSISEIRSLKLKRNLFIINVVSIGLASYFFVRHNEHCEGGSKFHQTSTLTFFLTNFLLIFVVYTFFALFEYIVVLTNMGFHMTAAIDFYDQHLAFDWRHGLHIHFQ